MLRNEETVSPRSSRGRPRAETDGKNLPSLSRRAYPGMQKFFFSNLKPSPRSLPSLMRTLEDSLAITIGETRKADAIWPVANQTSCSRSMATSREPKNSSSARTWGVSANSTLMFAPLWPTTVPMDPLSGTRMLITLTPSGNSSSGLSASRSMNRGSFSVGCALRMWPYR